MWQRLSFAVAIVFFLATIYLLWALYRIEPGTMIAEGPAWPRSAPYPDPWLVALNNYYESFYPAPPRVVKIHGELPRVQLTVCMGAAFCGAVAIAAALPIALRWYRSWRGRLQGFTVVTTPRRAE